MKKTGKKEPKIGAAEVDDQIIRFLRNEPNRFSDWEKVPRMDYEFKLVRSRGGGASMILGIRDNTATIMTPETVAELLRNFILRLPPKLSSYYIDGTRCLKIIRSFCSSKPHYESMPKSVGFKSDPDLVLNRLSFDPIPTDLATIAWTAPVFSSMLERLTNLDAFMCRIGSIFDPNADRKQAVWLYGPRDCGKSQFAFLLQELCPNFAILGTDDQENPYFKAMLLGNRLGLVMEAGAKFIRSEAFKATTGDGTHAINQKYQPIFNAPLDILYFCFSNNAPEIPNDDSLIVRVIACKISEIPTDQPRYGEKEFQAMLLKELPYIAGCAIECYSKLKPGSRIPCSNDDLKDSIESYEEEFTEFIGYHVIEEKGYKTTFREMTRLFEFGGYRSNFEKHRLKQILEKMLPVTKRVCRTKISENQSVRTKVWEGVRIVNVPSHLSSNITITEEKV